MTVCSTCGCALEAALTRRGDRLVCYECLSGRRFEDHHLLPGLPVTVRLRANVHRALSDARTDPRLLAALLLAESEREP